MLFDIVKGNFGNRLILTGVWNSFAEKAYRLENCREIELNSGKGWTDDSLDFIKNIFPIYGLFVLSPYVKQCEVLNHLTGLKALQLDSNCKGDVDFSQFRSLVDLGFNWRKNGSSVFQCLGLQKLYINRFPGKDLADFKYLKHLSELILLGSSIRSLDGVDCLTQLKYLRVGLARSLSTIDMVSKLENLTQLEFGACRSVKDFSAVGNLHNLQRLELIDCGEVLDIDWIGSLKELREIYFYGDTNILSGNLYPLLELPHLKKVAFSARRHYSHTNEDLIF